MKNFGSDLVKKDKLTRSFYNLSNTSSFFKLSHHPNIFFLSPLKMLSLKIKNSKTVAKDVILFQRYIRLGKIDF